MRLMALVWPELRVPDADARLFERMLDALDDGVCKDGPVADGLDTCASRRADDLRFARRRGEQDRVEAGELHDAGDGR